MKNGCQFFKYIMCYLEEFREQKKFPRLKNKFF